MANNSIEIVGILSEEEISKYSIQYPYKEFCKSYNISLMKNKPKIGQILKVFLKPKISQWKYVFTQGKNKIFIESNLNIRVLFLENSYDKDIYSTEVNKTISGFLPVESNSIANLEPTIFIEDAFIAPLSENKFSLSLLVGIGTIVEIENKYIKIVDTEENFKQKVGRGNIEEAESENIEETNFREQEKYEDSQEVDYKDLEEIDFEKDIQGVNSQETDLQEKIDMGKLKENSINIDVEYDMNWEEENF